MKLWRCLKPRPSSYSLLRTRICHPCRTASDASLLVISAGQVQTVVACWCSLIWSILALLGQAGHDSQSHCIFTQAMVIWAANQDGISATDSSAMGRAVSREAAALVLEASSESAAARRLVAQMGATLAQRLPSMALLQLFLALLEIPSVKQVRCCLEEAVAAHEVHLAHVCRVHDCSHSFERMILYETGT